MTTTIPSQVRPLLRAVVIAGLPLMAIGSGSALAQSTELDELRERVQQLENKLEGAVSTAPLLHT